MIPRQIPVPDDAEIRPQFAWAALILAHQHKIDQLAEGEAWTCQCRCCRWARTVDTNAETAVYNMSS